MQRKKIVLFLSLAGLGFLAITSVLLSNKQILSLRRLLGSKAAETGGSAIQLTVSNTEAAKTSNKILGYSTLVGIGGTWKLETDTMKNWYKTTNNGINRIMIEGKFTRIEGQTQWKTWWQNKTLQIRDRRLYLQKSATDEMGNWVYQDISATEFVVGKKYRLMFDYETKDLQQAPSPSPDHDHYRIAYITTGSVDSHDNGVATDAAPFYFPLGTQSGKGSIEFTYNPPADKDPYWVRIGFWLHSPGEVYIDNLSLTSNDNPAENLVRDPGFDTSQSDNSIITPKDIDDNMAFNKAIGQEPLVSLNNPWWYIPDKKMSADAIPNGSYDYILNNPNLSLSIDNVLDEIRYINIDKQYGVKYFEYNNEPEQWWPGLGLTYNQRYYLYGRLYSLLAKRAKQLDPSIKLGVPLFSLAESSKGTIDGFFDGIKDHERLHPNDTATVPVPMPDFFATHATYQMRGWDPHICSHNDPKTCISALLTYAGPSGPAFCGDTDTEIGNVDTAAETISIIEPYFKCINNYLKTKGIANPVHIPTEWGPSGSAQYPFQYYGSALWAADRIGRIARTGIYGQNFLVGFLEGNPTYPIFTLYGRFLGPSTSVLQTTTTADDKVSMYTFKNPGDPKLYAVLTNRIIEDGTTPVTVNLPSNVTSFKANQIEVNCQGADCLWSDVYENGELIRHGSDVYVNGNKIRYLVDAVKANDILKNTVPTAINSDSNSITISMPNHSVLFWEIETTETQAKNNLPKRDFNGDGKEDILWRNDKTGEGVMWFMNGASYGSWDNYEKQPLDQKIVATADFNNDGKSDIVWRNNNTGELSVWLMNGKEVISKNIIQTPIPAGTEFDFIGLGDLNGDKLHDIILRNRVTGENGMWYLSGTQFVTWNRFETAPVSMNIQTIADFNQDGKSDLLWRDATTGDISIWLMDNERVLSKSAVATVPAEWAFVHTGDFDGDGNIDLFWRNKNTGENSIWFFNKTQRTSNPSVQTQPVDWQAVQFSDFNNDGNSDILWSNRLTGGVQLWIMNGSTVTSKNDISTVPTEWKVYPLSQANEIAIEPTSSISPILTPSPTAMIRPTLIPTRAPTATPIPTVPPGTHITIRAYGTVCQGVYPTMVLKIGNSEMKRWTNVGSTIANYSFDSTAIYSGRISVNFINDCYRPQVEDRNLFVDYVVINGTTIQSEAQGVYNNAGSGEWLWGNGYILYPQVTTPVATLTPTRIPLSPTSTVSSNTDSSVCISRYGQGASCQSPIDCIRSNGRVIDTYCATGSYCCLH